MRKKRLLLALALALCLSAAVLLSACGHTHEFSGDWSSDGTHHWHSATCKHTEEQSERGEHTFGEGVTTTEPTPTEAGVKTFTCSVCGYEKTEVIPPVSTEAHTHSFTGTVVAPTCAERGYTDMVCACGVTYKDNYTNKTEHIVTAFTAVGDGTHTGVCTLGHTVTLNCQLVSSVTAPDCETQGYTTYTCSVCSYSYRDNYVTALGHSFNSGYEHNASYHWHSASCSHSTERAEYSGHVYTETVTAPSCTEGGYTTYTCACGYSYVGSHTAPTGHTVTEWTLLGSSLLDPDRCAYTDSYRGTCDTCGTDTEKNEIVEKHAYYWAITTPATCKNEGVKTYVCASKECRYHTPGAASSTQQYSDPAAHKWKIDDEKSTASVTVYKCDETGCTETKSIILSTSDNVTVSDTVLNGTSEITLPEATINFDASAKGALSGKGQISVSASTLDDAERETAILSANLTNEQKASIRGKKIYSFTASTDADADIHRLNGDAKITLPYTLAPGENPEYIVVWYLSSAGLEAISADYFKDAYGAGYVSFVTDHFSSYTVGELTAEERCAKYGHMEKVFAATCTEGGYTVCTVCDKILSVSRPQGHNWHSTVTEAATCSANGQMTVSCSACGHSYSEIIPAIGHYYKLADYKAASCETAGYSKYSCIYCNDSYTVSSAALMHDYVSTVKAATCTEGGYTEKSCRRCAHTITVDNVAPLGHTYSAVWSTLADGHYHSCTVCGGRSDIDAHIPGTPATETTAEICSVCEYIITPALGHTHTLTKVDAIAPDCLTGGNSEYYVCNCGKWFRDAEGSQLITDHTAVFLDAKGHTLTSVPAVDATCTAGGVTSGVKCSVCNKVLRGCVATSPLGHSYTAAVTAPTCTAGGYTVYTCHCGDTYTADLTAPLGHKTVSTVTAPTCTAGGFTTDACVRCSYTLVHSERAALGHSYSEKYSVTADAHYHECERCGSETAHIDHVPDYPAATEAHGIKCTVCDYEIAPAVNHTHRVEKTTAAKEPTCTEAGNLAYYTCSCGDRFLDAACTVRLGSLSEVVLSPLGHKIKAFNRVEPTCTEAGHEAGAVCERCEKILSGGAAIPALGHVEVTIPGTAATCTAPGKENGTACDRCKNTLEEGAVIPALGHIEENFSAKAATCTEAGHEAGVKCTRCNSVISGGEEIAVLGHIEVTIPGTAATCTAPGSTDGVKCDRCGETLKASETIPALGHNEVTIPGTAATCTAPGMTDGVECDRCGVTLTESEEIPALGHNEVTIPGKPATCTAPGMTDGVECDRCGEILVKSEVISQTPHTYEDGFCTGCGASVPAAGMLYTYEFRLNYESVVEIHSYTFTDDGVVTLILRKYADGALIEESEPEYAEWFGKNGYVFVGMYGENTAFAVSSDGVTLEMISSNKEILKYHYYGTESVPGYVLNYLYLFYEDGSALIEFEAKPTNPDASGGEAMKQPGTYAETDEYLLFVSPECDVVPFVKADGGITIFQPSGDEAECLHNEILIMEKAAGCQIPASRVYYCVDCGRVRTELGEELGSHVYVGDHCIHCGRPETDEAWSKTLRYVAVFEKTEMDGATVIPIIFFYEGGSSACVVFDQSGDRSEQDPSSGGLWELDENGMVILRTDYYEMGFQVMSDGYSLRQVYSGGVTSEKNTLSVSYVTGEDGSVTVTLSVLSPELAAINLTVLVPDTDGIEILSSIEGAAVNAADGNVRFSWFSESYTNLTEDTELLVIRVSADKVHLSVFEIYSVNSDGDFGSAQYFIKNEIKS